MSNFRFLAEEWPALAQEAMEAERFARTAPIPSAVYARRTLEKTVRWLYANDRDLRQPYDDQLSALMDTAEFRELIPPAILPDLHYIRKTGNAAAHDKKVVDSQSVACVKLLHRFLKWFARTYSAFDIEVSAFEDEAMAVKVKTKEVPSVSVLNTLQAQYEAQRQQLERELEQRLKLEGEKQALEAHLAAVQARKEQQRTRPVPESPYTEAETRLLFIDELLREAGWDPAAPNVPEYPVTGMPLSTNPNGNGSVDYVLWGADGKPLAVVEAKRTLVNEENGRVQAGLYADCLERMHRQRPVMYYTNGFNTWCWDDTFAAPRPVQGFHTRDELQLLVDRRRTRADIRQLPVDPDIAGRYYQQEAIRRVAESWVALHEGSLRARRRRALVVMATGSGKTRTAAALVDMLMKGNWVKRVLFLADRNALVTQAKRAFEKYLPNVTTLDLTRSRYDESARIVFSTYPTMLNRIDQSRSDDLKTFGVGHFDLVIVDEAHRSVYERYKAIFDYFDSLLLGLTATPRSEGDRDTYALFDCEEHNPTYYYELDQAVKDRFLVPPLGQEVDLGFMARGIRYADLDESDQRHYEETFRDADGAVPDEIGAQAINSWLFNTHTIDQALAHVMTHGIKVEGGDKLGKTIVFARNHPHALAIRQRFEKQFPHYAGHFLAVIDNEEKYAQDLIDRFSDARLLPQIAVSVDMLDTGIDIPEVVNLVFFKPVYSKAKFWQMVGRGTRLCPDLFGPGEDKTHFRIFDLCRNYSFFDVTPEGIPATRPKGVSHRLFEANLLLAQAIGDDAGLREAHAELHRQLLDRLHGWVAPLWERRNTVQVRPVKRLLDTYRERPAWEGLGPSAISDLCQHLAPVVEVPDQDEMAKRFDLLIADLQLAMITSAPQENALFRQLHGTAEQLDRMANIPAVQVRIPAIRAVLSVAQDPKRRREVLGLEALEFTRSELRELVRLIRRDKRNPVFTELKDSIVNVGEDRYDLPGGYAMRSYRLKVEQFIRQHRHHLTIHKLHTNEPITAAELLELERLLFDGDERGTKEALMEELGDPQPLGVFIRSIIGLDAKAAKEAFGEFLSRADLRADQIRFIDQLITHLTINGIIDKRMLADPPFTEINDQGIFGVFEEEDQDRIISIVDRVNATAERAGSA
ncbi:MAG: DEAD/DEAH box helicase family protein [Flavobacteriales bacterium]|nr:DEAD/DEAH box helicase family protein [Flavobacteriales bacterium]